MERPESAPSLYRSAKTCCGAITFANLICPILNLNSLKPRLNHYLRWQERDKTMKRGLVILACICAVIGGVYVAGSKWAIRHQTLDLFDATRQRPVSVDAP